MTHRNRQRTSGKAGTEPGSNRSSCSNRQTSHGKLRNLSSPADAGEQKRGGLNGWNGLNSLNYRCRDPLPATGEAYCSIGESVNNPGLGVSEKHPLANNQLIALDPKLALRLLEDGKIGDVSQCDLATYPCQFLNFLNDQAKPAF
jgi:hypothetical protein